MIDDPPPWAWGWTEVKLAEARKAVPSMSLLPPLQAIQPLSPMEIVWLIFCASIAWFICTTIDLLPGLGQLLVPSPWMLIVAGLGLATWLMHDDERS
ncbi:hypothetical protein GFS31_17190 [Leptolyngbya sp. BL0902]|uniref:hypothetical protein n=1 Tax=Leptolyngbya sp. BL0902 TaxID=1115757 RepID=UPI0018E82715|nr:hypothetical protein [Leptolyngbya sp. BL0902]QQE65034.1 hypothetical protein GFS31_17190 [Leptolyngbya sp. BL0902]